MCIVLIPFEVKNNVVISLALTGKNEEFEIAVLNCFYYFSFLVKYVLNNNYSSTK